MFKYHFVCNEAGSFSRLCPRSFHESKSWLTTDKAEEYWKEKLSEDSVKKMWSECGAEGKITQLADIISFQYSVMPFAVHSQLSLNPSGIPVAFSILAHKNLGQLATLLSLLARDRHSFCVYVDPKAKESFKEGVKIIINCLKSQFPQERNKLTILVGQIVLK